MKKIINYRWVASLMVLVALLATISCSKESATETPEVGTNLQPIKVYGHHSSEATKTLLKGLVTHWVRGDEVGIFSPQAGERAGGFGEIKNRPFMAESNEPKSSLTSSFPMYWGEENAPHTFYAYYPYNPKSTIATAIPISLSAVQITTHANYTGHLNRLDFLVATPLTVVSPSNTNPVYGINQIFNHLFTVIEFSIKGKGKLNAVRLMANQTLAFESGTIDITQPTPSAGDPYTFAIQTERSNEVEVTLNYPPPLDLSKPDKAYMVINPITPTGNCLISVKIDGTWKYMIKAAPVGGFKRGTKYGINIETSDLAELNEGEVLSLTGRIWMDKNLGASRVATSVTDSDAYGDLYQWGRGTDGHEKRTSGITNTKSYSVTPGHSWFILPKWADHGTVMDWLETPNGNLWQGVNGTNNPCPPGFRLPTVDEWKAEIATWSPRSAIGAFKSPLKLTMAGLHVERGLIAEGSSGSYWASTYYQNTAYPAGSLSFDNDNGTNPAGTGGLWTCFGLSVRCIKD